MAKHRSPYRRLTRNSSGVGTYASLWLGHDHLMIVRSSGYNESYARLQFSDVKAVFVTSSNRRGSWGVFWGSLALPAAVIFIVSLVNREPPIFSSLFLALGLVGLVWNHLLGPGCRTYVMTGVQTAELPSLVRSKKARRVLAQISPLIAQAQVHLTAPPPATASPVGGIPSGGPVPPPAGDAATTPQSG